MRFTLLRCSADCSSGLCSMNGVKRRTVIKTHGIGLSFSAFACVFVLVFDFAAGARLQDDQSGTNVVFIDSENHGLLAIVLVRVADGEEMLPLFGEQEERR